MKSEERRRESAHSAESMGSSSPHAAPAVGSADIIGQMIRTVSMRCVFEFSNGACVQLVREQCLDIHT